MKISCTQENLNKGIGTVSRIVGTRGTLPILSHILLSTQKGRLKLVGTDLEIAIITYIGGKIDEEGAVTIPARLLSEFVSANRDQTIDFQSDGNNIKATSNHITARLNGLDFNDFPLIPEVKSDQIIKVNATDLKEAIGQVAFATATDDSRPILTGVFIKVVGKEMTLVATDSYRLAERKMEVTNDNGKDISVIVPARTLHEVSRLIDASIKEVSITVAQNQISFDFNSSQIVSRVLEGTFPDYEQIIPKEVKTKVTLGTDELQNALKLGISFAREVANNIKIEILGSQNIQVIATSPQVGETTAKIDSKNEGDDLEIAFNAKFLSDVLSNCLTKEVRIDFSGNLSAAIINPIGKKNYRALVMPLRLDQV
jgi:DNA polymerase-3 subunit beta